MSNVPQKSVLSELMAFLPIIPSSQQAHLGVIPMKCFLDSLKP